MTEDRVAGDVDPARLIFIGGLHRSGTTALGRVLASHASISGFSGTDSIEDEGQHLQDVYLPAQRFGGPGRFARDDRAHLGPVIDAVALRRRLLDAWTPHWDLSRPLLVEKSPPNMIMGRYLQSVFPGSRLVVILRHPVIVALGTKKWRRTTPLSRLVEHWFLAHDRLRADAPTLEHLHIMRYEDLVGRPEETLHDLARFLEITPAPDASLIQRTRSDGYVSAWESMSSGRPLQRAARARIEKRFGSRAAEYGYDIGDVEALHASWFGVGRGG